MKVSVIIPVLNEEKIIQEKLPALQRVRKSGHEVIVVDGGSKDDSVKQAKLNSDAVITSVGGRATQMNAGASLATGDVYLFLHIDTILPADGINKIIYSMEDGNGDTENGNAKEAWGRFDVRLSGHQFMFRIIERMMNWRSRITGIATGDQGIFINRLLFEQVGGYRDMPLMEDVEICSRLRKVCRPLCLSEQVVTSSRRWEVLGIVRTVLLMWWLRFSYWLGADPVRLAKQYYR